MIPHIITDSSITLVYNGSIKIFSQDSPEYAKSIDFIRNGDEKGLVQYLDSFKNKIEKSYQGFSVRDGIVYLKTEDGEVDLPKILGDRLKRFADENLPYQPVLAFMNRLSKNPSYDSVCRLYACLEANSHPLLADGRFLAWRKVRRDPANPNKLVDIYTGKHDNSVGEKLSMPRNQVNDDHSVTCSSGYHASSWDYAKNHYGSRDDVMIEVAVDPADVVSVPNDYNNQKMRICAYEVLKIVETENTKPLANPEDYYEDEDLDDDNDSDSCPDCGAFIEECNCDDYDLCDECGEEFMDCECGAGDDDDDDDDSYL